MSRALVAAARAARAARTTARSTRLPVVAVNASRRIFSPSYGSRVFLPRDYNDYLRFHVHRNDQLSAIKRIIEPASGSDIWPEEEPAERLDTSFSRPMLSFVQVVLTPTADTPGACLLLHFENRRYLFGRMAEGTQRVMQSRKLPMSKAAEIFVTGPTSWQSMGGLLGIVVSLADILQERKSSMLEASTLNDSRYRKKRADPSSCQERSLRIHGPRNLSHLLATARQFIFRKAMALKVVEVRSETASQDSKDQGRKPDFEDSNIQVWCLTLTPQRQPMPQPRKRSYDDMVSSPPGQRARQTASNKTEKAELDRQVIDNVVKNMFDSDWRPDVLTETTLHKAPLPAALFVKGEDGEMKRYDGPLPAHADEGGGLGEMKKFDGPLPGFGIQVPDIQVFVRKPWPAAKIKTLPRTSPCRESLCYIAKGQPRRGKFNVQEAIRLEVQKQDYKRLIAGQTVKGKDGVDVTPDMCVAPPVEGRCFAVIDLPNASYIDPLLARPEWSDDTFMKTMDVMYWILGTGVGSDPRIQAFTKKLSSVKHKVFSPDYNANTIGMESSASLLIKAHALDPDRFPLPQFSNTMLSEDTASHVFKAARSGEKFQMAPNVLFKEDEIVPLMDTLAPLSDLNKDVVDLANKAKAKLSDPEFLARIEQTEWDIPNRDTEVIPLGTGSALPAKYRNVSSTLVRVPGFGSYLFDCGENTLGQLRRMYGYAGADEVLRDLKVLWISHLHADHHLGTVSVIRAWRDAMSAPAATEAQRAARLTIASYQVMLDWLHEYLDVENYGYDRLRLVQIDGKSTWDAIQEPVIFERAVARELGITRIDSVRVNHCKGSLACVFTWPSGLRIAYSGDCRPSEGFARIGRGATLLIHESTLDDELQEDAISKKHCTMSEALGVAASMKARRVLLTHFSQRYPKIATGNHRSGNGGVKDQVVLMAFDQMRVKLGDFKKAELFWPALQLLLEEEVDPEEARPRL